MFLGWPSNRPVIYRSSKQDFPAKAAHKVNEFMSHQQLGSTTALVSELYNSASHQCSAAPGAQLSRPRGPFALNPIRQKTSGASAGNEEDTKRRRDSTRLHVGQSGLRFQLGNPSGHAPTLLFAQGVPRIDQQFTNLTCIKSRRGNRLRSE